MSGRRTGARAGSRTTARAQRRADRTVTDLPVVPEAADQADLAGLGAGTGLTPAVNLLSPWVLLERRVAHLRRRFALGTVALAILLAGAWGWQQLRLADTRDQLAQEKLVGTGLSTRIDRLKPVEAYVAAVKRRATTVRTTMYAEVSTARVLAALRDALPPGTTLESVSLTQPAPGAATGSSAKAGTATGEGSGEGSGKSSGSSSPTGSLPVDLDPARGIGTSCPGPDPFAVKVVVGCATITGSAPDRAAVAALVRRLAREELFVEPFVSTTTVAAEDPVTFTGSVGLSPAAFTGRYDALAAKE